ncbi:VWA domain-containing protein [Actinokineospora sp. PR83]|uniref:vWA domain-containing protein n=1 Tax=Actinokineospora sp. PR83 TaxID=2884908 RepID=UPI001F1CCC8B|nr:vWA domain-containing protein [Actinokineospora sp. PR83]MCG8915890.1 VWA domain-containing protein [Actinokineospora sp. PR83]
MRRFGAAMAAVLVVAGGAPAGAVDGTLPGGIGIAVDVEAPLPDTVIPKGTTTVVGTASVGTGAVPPTTSVTYVLDGSGSLSAAGFAQEKAAVERFHRQYALNPAYGIGSVGLATFATDGRSIDVDAAPGTQLAVAPTADNNGSGAPDFLEALGAMPYLDGSTNFIAGLERAAEVSAATTGTRKLVLFLSDGRHNVGTGGEAERMLADLPDAVDIHTFGFGPDASCQGGPVSLERIARATGGTCSMSGFADLGQALSRLLASELHHLTLTVDGGPELPITDITPALPQPGPKQVRYTVRTPPLDVGNHPLCVTAHGSDYAGPGKVTDCTNVIILAPSTTPGPTTTTNPPATTTPTGATSPGAPPPAAALPGNSQVSAIPRGGVATGGGTVVP